jgi:hypothetical protein
MRRGTLKTLLHQLVALHEDAPRVQVQRAEVVLVGAEQYAGHAAHAQLAR